MIDPAELWQMAQRTKQAQDALAAEAVLRFASAENRFMVDPEFHYRVLYLVSSYQHLHSNLSSDENLKIAIESIVLLEMLDLHLAGGI